MLYPLLYLILTKNQEAMLPSLLTSVDELADVLVHVQSLFPSTESQLLGEMYLL